MVEIDPEYICNSLKQSLTDVIDQRLKTLTDGLRRHEDEADALQRRIDALAPDDPLKAELEDLHDDIMGGKALNMERTIAEIENIKNTINSAKCGESERSYVRPKINIL